MTSKQEIKDLFIAELINTPEYAITLDIKQLILNQIATPNVQSQVVYNFSQILTEDEIGIVKMCMLLEFGFEICNISNQCVVIDMKNFLI
jgi:hypothetical protein